MVVVVTCCAFILLLLLVLLRVLLLSSASALPCGRQQKDNDGNRLMNEPKVSSETDAQGGIEMGYIPPVSEPSHSSSSSSPGSSRRRNSYSYQDSHYLNMQSVTNLWKLVHTHMCENVLGHLEFEQHTRQVSNVVECEYVSPDDTHFPLMDAHESDPDDSQC